MVIIRLCGALRGYHGVIVLKMDHEDYKSRFRIRLRSAPRHYRTVYR